MTLAKQLYALIFIISLLMGIGTLFISVENTRSYLLLQLTTQTQNAADSLGLSLVPYMKESDIAAMDTMVNAVFDGGYYKSLKLTRMNGERLIERENTSQIDGVPQWFINRLKLETPVATSVITTGWTQAGILTLKAHPGFAYKKLWQTTIETIYFALLVFLLSLLLAFFVLKAILRPLTSVEEQALAICNREFPVLKKIPKTRELQRVVLAMNKMSVKVKSIIANLSERAEVMQKEAYFDDMTEIMNRRGFLALLENTVKDQEKSGLGSLALIRLSQFADYNKAHGYQAGDELLMDMVALIHRATTGFEKASIARSEGAEFAVIIPLLDADMADQFGQACSTALNELGATLQIDNVAHIGIVGFSERDTVPEILSSADMALASAQHEGPNSYVISNVRDVAIGNQGWKQLIEEAMAQHRIYFFQQQVVNADSKPIYSEVLIRVKDGEGDDVSPAIFVSMADRLELNKQLDRYIIEQVTALPHIFDATGACLGINLSARSILDVDFVSWLESHLQANGSKATALLFEVSEHALLQDLSAAKSLIDMIHRCGSAVVMEHFGTKLSSFKTLRELKLDYIKIDGSYIRNISESKDNRFFLQTLIDIAHGLDIRVIAEHVETEADCQSLKSLGINAMQGYLFGSPSRLK